jgi:hypothetical protein
MDAVVVCKAALDADVGSKSAHCAVFMSQVALDSAIDVESAILSEVEEAVVVCKAALHTAKVSEDALDAAILSWEADPVFVDALV